MLVFIKVNAANVVFDFKDVVLLVEAIRSDLVEHVLHSVKLLKRAVELLLFNL